MIPFEVGEVELRRTIVLSTSLPLQIQIHGDSFSRILIDSWTNRFEWQRYWFQDSPSKYAGIITYNSSNNENGIADDDSSLLVRASPRQLLLAIPVLEVLLSKLFLTSQMHDF